MTRDLMSLNQTYDMYEHNYRHFHLQRNIWSLEVNIFIHLGRDPGYQVIILRTNSPFVHHKHWTQ